MSNSDNAPVQKPLVDAAKEWLQKDYEDEIDEFATAYDNESPAPLRDEAIQLSVEGLSQNMGEDLAGELIDKGTGAVETSVREAIKRLVNDRLEDEKVEMGEPLDEGWCIEWVDPIDEMYVDISTPLSRHTGEMVAIRGRVRHRTDPVPWFRTRKYACQRCGSKQKNAILHSPADIVRGQIKEPYGCDNETCNAGQNDFEVLTEGSDMRDHQYITIEQSPGVDGSTPSKIGCWLFGEGRLVDASEGERVTVVGRLKMNPDSDTTEHYLMATGMMTDREDNTVEVTDDDREIVHETVEDADDPLETAANSLAPNVHGHQLPKKGLILAGVGSGLDAPDEQTHAMLIGDPGTAKTELTSAVRDVIPSTRQASLTQSSSVGLTASAVKETVGGSEEWVIRAGALSLASGGILTIDELDEADFDLSQLNDALSEGEIPVDKAGESTRIKTDTRVIATANPESAEFDPHEPLGDQIQFTADVVSRFDLAFPFIDDSSDEEMNEGIMRATAADYLGEEEMTEEYADYAPDVDRETLRMWIAVAQEHDPTITSDAMEEIKNAWMILRDSTDGGTININPRRLPTVIRLSRAHARLRLADEVTPADARAAFSIVSAMLGEWGYDVTGDSNSGSPTSGKSSDFVLTGQKRDSVREAARQMEDASADEIRDTLEIPTEGLDEVKELVEEARSSDDGDGLGAELAADGGDRQ